MNSLARAVSLCSLLFTGLVTAQTRPTIQPDDRKLSLSFEANQGQTDPQVHFTSRGNGIACSSPTPRLFNQTEKLFRRKAFPSERILQGPRQRRAMSFEWPWFVCDVLTHCSVKVCWHI